MGRPCETVHPDPAAAAAGCRICFLFETRPDYRLTWGGDPFAARRPTGFRPEARVWYCKSRDAWDWAVVDRGVTVAGGTARTEAEAREDAADAVVTVRVRFAHGIGDATNFAHMIPLFARRGYAVEVGCRDDEWPLFAAAGADRATGVVSDHPWAEAPRNGPAPGPHPWSRNKNAWNLFGPDHPMPRLDEDPAKLWAEYTAVRLDLSPYITAEDRAAADAVLAGAPRPWIACHHRGFAWGAHRDYPDAMAVELWKRLIGTHGGTILVLDRDERSAKWDGARYARHFLPGQLYEILRRADLLVGIDSGPLNFVRFTDTPAVGIWAAHYPSDYALPRANTTHVVANRHTGRDHLEREHWNTVLAPDDGPSPEFVAEVVGRVLRARP